MEFSKGGKQKPGSVKKRTAADPEVKMKVKQVKAAEVDDSELPSKIKVDHSGQVAVVVPSSVWRCRPFKWDPQTFATESDELNQKFIEPSVQDASLLEFMENPASPMIYGIAGNPDDQKAKLLAAYLMDVHCKRFRNGANPWWINLTGGFDNPWLDKERRPSMIVIAGLTPLSTNVKLEKARDILETHTDIPRLVVVAGQDPLSFLSRRLFVPVNGLAYMCEALIKRAVEIV